MLGQRKALFLGNRTLPILDPGVKKFLDLTTVQTDQMIVVISLVELENRLAGFKMASQQNPGLFKLGEHPVDRGQPNVDRVAEQGTVDVFGRQMTAGRPMEDVQHLQTWCRDLQSGGFEILGAWHGPYHSGQDRSRKPKRT